MFKKLNDISGNPVSQQSAGQVVGSQGNAATGKDPYQSTFRSPANVYNANLGQEMGALETGLNRNIEQTQKDLSKSTETYKSGLGSINDQYKYSGPSDFENINDTATFSRLASLVNPAQAQTSLKSVQSNTANYRPDTSGVAAASTVGGLSSQLKNQYGTSSGGSRLDALLYRNSGQAGRAINDNLSKIDQFKEGQQNLLKAESDLLKQYSDQATERSNKVKQEGSSFQGQLLSKAQQQAAEAQANAANQRAALQAQLKQQADAELQKQLQAALANAWGDNRIRQSATYTDADLPSDFWTNPTYSDQKIDYTESKNQAGETIQTPKYTLNKDMTDQIKADLLKSFQPTNGFDINPYLNSAANINENQFLDPRYNRIGQLLGTDQRVVESAANPGAGYMADKFNTGLGQYTQAQADELARQVQALFARPEQRQGSGGKQITWNDLIPFLGNTNVATWQLGGTPAGWETLGATGLGSAANNIGNAISSWTGW